jgi:NTE family protein
MKEKGMSQNRSIVLGGGGVTGIAWEIGVLYELDRMGTAIREAEAIYGTSAGAFAATALTVGNLEARYEEQSLPSSEIPGAFSEELAKQYEQIFAQHHGDETKVGMAFGALARSAVTITPEARYAVVRERLRVTDWPSNRLNFAAIDASTGKLEVLNSSSGLNLTEAAAASGAVPGLWPIVHAGGRTWIDGGMYSAVNAHLASGYDSVLIIAPGASFDSGADSLSEAASRLRAQGAGVVTIEPDQQTKEAIGPNLFDPDRRAAAAAEGARQARATANTIRALWNNYS